MFRDGAPISVEMSVPLALFGERLADAGWVEESDLPDLVARAASEGKRLGEYIVDAAMAQPDVITRVLGEQLEARCAELVTLPAETTFAFYTVDMPERPRCESWDPLNVLLATVRAWPDRRRIHATVRWLAQRPLLPHPDARLDGLKLTTKEQNAMSEMRSGGATLDGLYLQHGEGLSSLLYTLAVTRQFAFSADKAPPMGVPREEPRPARAHRISSPTAGPSSNPTPSPASRPEPRPVSRKTAPLPGLTRPVPSSLYPPEPAPPPPEQGVTRKTGPLRAPASFPVDDASAPAIPRPAGLLGDTPRPPGLLADTPEAQVQPVEAPTAEDAPPTEPPPPPTPPIAAPAPSFHAKAPEIPRPLPSIAPPPGESAPMIAPAGLSQSIPFIEQPRAQAIGPTQPGPLGGRGLPPPPPLVLPKPGLLIPPKPVAQPQPAQPAPPPAPAPPPPTAPEPPPPAPPEPPAAAIAPQPAAPAPSPSRPSVAPSRRPLVAPSRRPLSGRASPSTAPPAQAAAPPARELPLRPSKPKVISPPARPAIDTKKKAAEDFRLGEEALARGDLKVAESHVMLATKGDPSRPEYVALFTWIAYQAGAELPETVRAFSRILEDHPECQPALYYRGMLLKEAGKDRAALRDFVTVARLNPDHIKALAEVKLLRARMPKV
jgi:hypothetical protein